VDRQHRPAPDYPENQAGGGPGVPGTFTFAPAGGDTDVLRYRYSGSGIGLQEVAAGADGRATVEITPTFYGTFQLTVEAVDRTLNRSPETTYEFSVIDPEPRIIDLGPGEGVGEPREIRFFSAVPGTVSFTCQSNDGPAVTVPAGADGSAYVTLTPDRPGSNPLVVTSRTASGVVSPEVRTDLYVWASVLSGGVR
jgi:hypothetical protein